MSTSVEGSTAGSTMLTILQRTTPGPTVASQFPLWSIALITLSLLLASSVCIEFAQYCVGATPLLQHKIVARYILHVASQCKQLLTCICFLHTYIYIHITKDQIWRVADQKFHQAMV